MDDGRIKTLKVLVHNSFVDHNLFGRTLVPNRIIKFKCLNKLLFGCSVALVSFKKGSAACGGLHNLHGEMFDMVVMNGLVIINVS